MPVLGWWEGVGEQPQRPPLGPRDLAAPPSTRHPGDCHQWDHRPDPATPGAGCKGSAPTRQAGFAAIFFASSLARKRKLILEIISDAEKRKERVNTRSSEFLPPLASLASSLVNMLRYFYVSLACNAGEERKGRGEGCNKKGGL